ncbi:RDD family protein [Suicoccus acidiformans]|nr:RDD family protein [Suicoccus acidiformans]
MIESYYPYSFRAGFWRRVPAFLFDGLMISLLRSVIFAWLPPSWLVSSLSEWALNLLIYHGYFILLTQLNHGQTLGKMLLSIQVVNEDGQELSWKQTFFREGIGRFLCNQLLYLPYLFVAFTQGKTHISDYLSDTYVLKDDFINISIENEKELKE